MFASTRLDAPGQLATDLGVGATWTESALVARSYLKWGARFAEHLSGDFAVVVWDRRERLLIACRDPFGVRSLFYRRAPSGIWFSRDLQALLRTFESTPALDDDRVVEHLLGIFSATHRTFFQPIRSVPPGQTVVFRGATAEAQTQTYWNPPAAVSDRRPSQPTTEFLEEFRELFRRSVATRLRGCPAAVVHVSGGVDSSVIALVGDQIESGASDRVAIVGAMASYPGFGCDEDAYVRPLERQLRFPVKRWDGTQSVAMDLVSPALDGPAFQSAFVNGTLGDIDIAQGQGAAVILSGTGGDELTINVGTAKDMLSRREWTRALDRVVLSRGSPRRRLLSRLKHLASQYLPASFATERAVRRFRVPPWLTAASRQRVGGIVAGQAAPVLDSAASADVWRRVNSPQLITSVEAVQRQATPFGVEYRFPFLDRELVRFVVSAAAAYWPARTRPHQRAFERQLPAVIGTRQSKADLTPAFANRIRRAAPLIEQLFSGGIWVSGRYVTREAALNAWRTFDWRTADGVTCRRIWSLVTLEAWLRRVFGYIPSP